MHTECDVKEGVQSSGKRIYNTKSGNMIKMHLKILNDLIGINEFLLAMSGSQTEL